MLTIEAQVLGKSKPLVPAWTLPTEQEAGEGVTTLRKLISRVVQHEVTAFAERQSERAWLDVLTSAQIADGAARGKIHMGGHSEERRVDVDGAVATAVQAFEDGLYVVFIDDVEQRELDVELWLKPDSRMKFIRLTFLAGG